MTKLHQVIAVDRGGVETRAKKRITELYRLLKVAPAFAGLARTYRRLNDDGEQYPNESTNVQVTAPAVLAEVSHLLTRVYDLAATKEAGNQKASADLVLADGTVIAQDVPVGFLLFLEKRLLDIRSIVSDLPVLDPAETWAWNPNTATYATPPVETAKAKKIPRNHVRAAATERHPAQVDVYNEDVVIGYWATVKFSGALPAETKVLYQERVEALITAVKLAREKANEVEVDDVKVGADIFGYLFRA